MADSEDGEPTTNESGKKAHLFAIQPGPFDEHGRVVGHRTPLPGHGPTRSKVRYWILYKRHVVGAPN